MGEQGNVGLTVAFGGLLALLGLASMARGAWSLTVGTRRLEQRARQALKLPQEPGREG